MSEQYGGPWNNPGGPPPSGPEPGPEPYAQAPYGTAQNHPGGPPLPVPPWGGPAFGMAPLRTDYAPWIRRVGAFLIDFLPGLVGTIIFYVGYGIALFDGLSSGNPTLDLGAGAIPMIVGGALLLLGAAWNIYNRWIVGGRTGQSLGKRVLGLRLIGDETGAPLGPVNAFVRDLVHVIDGFAYVGYLWPLWDERKQTFSDKIMKSVVVSASQGPGTRP